MVVGWGGGLTDRQADGQDISKDVAWRVVFVCGWTEQSWRSDREVTLVWWTEDRSCAFACKRDGRSDGVASVDGRKEVRKGGSRLRTWEETHSLLATGK